MIVIFLIQLNDSMNKVLAKACKNKPHVQKQPATRKVMLKLKNLVGDNGSKFDSRQDEPQLDETVISKKKRTGIISHLFNKKQKAPGEYFDSVEDERQDSTIKTKKKRSGRIFGNKRKESGHGDETNLLIDSDDDEELY